MNEVHRGDILDMLEEDQINHTKQIIHVKSMCIPKRDTTWTVHEASKTKMTFRNRKHNQGNGIGSKLRGEPLDGSWRDEIVSQIDTSLM